MSRIIRVHYIGGQYTDFANTTQEDYSNLIAILNNNEKSFVLNNQWINKENILTVIQFEAQDLNEKEKEIVFDDSKDAIDTEEYTYRPAPCC